MEQQQQQKQLACTGSAKSLEKASERYRFAQVAPNRKIDWQLISSVSLIMLAASPEPSLSVILKGPSVLPTPRNHVCKATSNTYIFF